MPDVRKGRADLQADLLVAELGRLGTHALVPGERDLAQGLAAYRARVESAQLPVIAANLVDATTGKRLFPGSRVVDVAGRKIGLVGAVGESVLGSVAEVRVTPLEPAVKREVAEVRSAGAELVVLLAHARVRTVERALPAMGGIHLAIAGHDRRFLNPPKRVGDTVLVGGGDRGRHVGHLELVLVSPPWLFEDAGLADSLAHDIELLQKRKDYYERMRDGATGDKAAALRATYDRKIVGVQGQVEDKTRALTQAKARKLDGNRFTVVSAPMSADVPDDPTAAKAVGACKVQLAALKPPAPRSQQLRTKFPALPPAIQPPR